jgi:prevent-host-death family protein
MTKSLSSREFNQDIGKAKRLADEGPVIVTDRGNPAYVLMTHAEYVKLTKGSPSILDLLDHPESAHIDFEPKRLKGGRIRSKGLF